MVKLIFKKILLIGLIPVFIISCGNSEKSEASRIFSQYPGKYILFISKKKFTISVYERDKGAVAQYKIGLGSNKDMLPKLYEGDDRTPEGIYAINEILSMDSSKETESYRKLRMMNEYYFKKSAGYHKFANSEEDLGDNAYGPRYYGISYPNKKDEQRYSESLKNGSLPSVKGKPASIGFGIAIHGNNDEESIGHLCSSGCMRMYNNDIVELEKFISLGTPVIIVHN